MTAKTLMIQGTASSVGKSLMVAALCRLFRDQGLRVAPFKSQNMALNSAVTADGLEIGRAQAVQARAARIPPTVDMNPILLKPETDMRAQVVLRGQPIGTMRFGEYHERRPELVRAIEESLDTLRAEHDLVVIEGAGSPAEINLKDRDIVNGFVAELADAPVLLVGDIDRGGVFAALFGTLELLDEAERARIAGFVINKFRGEYDILAPALPMIESRLGRPVLGVVPFLHELRLPEEDGMAIEARRPSAVDGQLDVAVTKFPHMSNFDDFLPLQRHSDISVRWIDRPIDVLRADLLVLPGTKSTVNDLEWMRQRKLDRAVQARVELGLPVLGICGGCQMLGSQIEDPFHVESDNDRTPGLGVLPVQTVFDKTKVTRQVELRSRRSSFLGRTGTTARGYFIHMGRASADAAHALFESPGGELIVDGAVSEDGVVVGTMLHGLFDSTEVVDALVASVRTSIEATTEGGFHPDPEAEYDRLASHVGEALDMRAIQRIAGIDVRDA